MPNNIMKDIRQLIQSLAYAIFKATGGQSEPTPDLEIEALVNQIYTEVQGEHYRED